MKKLVPQCLLFKNAIQQNAGNRFCIYVAKGIGLLMMAFLFSIGNVRAQLNTFPTAINFTAAQPSYITTPSGTSYSTTLTNCSSVTTGGVSYTSSGKSWTLIATKCGVISWTIKQPSTARTVTVSNNKNSTTKATTGTANACTNDQVDFAYDGSGGPITITFAGASGGSSEAVIAVTINAPTPGATLATNGSAIAAGQIGAGLTKVIDSFKITTTGSTTLSQVILPTTGDYTSSDISSLQLWANTTGSNFGGATSIKSITPAATGTGANETFGSLSQAINSTTVYFYITATAAATPTSGRTITAGIIPNANLSWSAGSPTATGSTSATGTQTIIVLPSITTTNASSINTTSASSGGNISSAGGGTVTRRGLIYSTGTITDTSNTTGGGKIIDGAGGTGSYTSSLSSLTANTLYHSSAFAVNGAGVALAADASFTTLPNAPGIGTTDNVTNGGFTVHWTAPSGGSASFTYSVDYSTDNTFQSGVSSITNISSSNLSQAISGLTPGSTYYARVFAVNTTGTSGASGTSAGVLIPSSSPPAVSTQAASSVQTTSATGNGTIVSTGSSSITASGIAWSTSTGTETISSGTNFTTDGPTGSTTGAFTSSISGLTANTLYYAETYGSNGDGTTFGNEVTFSTLPNAPGIGVGDGQTFNSFVAHWSAPSGGSVSFTYTVDYSTDNTFQTGVTSITNISSSNTSQSISGLNPATTYYFRVFAVNATGTSAASSTSAGVLTLATTPTVTTTALSSITITGASSGGTVTATGGAAVSAEGVVWDASANPTTALSTKTSDGTSSPFTSAISSLTANTAYHVRAYATNTAGTAYGSDLTFTTLPNAPTAGVGDGITTTGFTAHWSAPSGGSASFTYTVQYSTDNTFQTGVSSITSISSSNTSQAITGLAGATTYYFRVFAVNTTGSSDASNVSAGVTTNFGPIAVFTDNFNRANTTYSPGGTPTMTYTGSFSSGASATAAGTGSVRDLQITNGSGGASGRSLVSGTLSTYGSPFNTALSANPGLITWTFNMRTSSSSGGSFSSSSSAIGTVLCGTTSTPLTISPATASGNGYALISISNKTWQLVHYTGGLANVTTIGSSFGSSGGTDWMDFKVTYDPGSGLWNVYDTDNGSAFGDPTAATTQQVSSALDSTYASSAMTTFGFALNYSSTSGRTGDFDNYTVTVTPAPVVTNSVLTASGTNGVAFSTYTITATNFPTSYNATGLPTGLSINTSNGQITGTPSVGGTFNVTISATNAGGTRSKTLVITLAKANSTISVTGTTSFTYNGSQQGPSTSSVTGSAGAVTYSYSGTGSTTYGPSATKPTNVGTYSVTATVAADANFNSASSSATPFTIALETWTGNTSSDWNTGSNWADGTTPSSGSDVVIASGSSHYPVLTVDVTVGALNLQSGTTFGIGSKTLTINGTISGSGTLSGSSISNLTLANSGTNPTLSFTSGAAVLQNLVLNTSATATLGTALDIASTGSVEVKNTGTTTGVLTTAGLLTLKSDDNGTAFVKANSSGNTYVSGAVTVERFIPSSGTRAWRMLSIPTQTTQTIKESWQEGQAPIANYGTIITAGPANSVDWAAQGFDAVQTYSSMVSYNQANNTWDQLTSTLGQISDQQAYFLYVRGDRTIGPSSSTSTVSSTTLRTTGDLFEGDQTTIVPAGKYSLLGNKYASSIDFSGIVKDASIDNSFIIWDPKLLLGGSLGHYQTFSSTTSPSWMAVPGGGSYGDGITPFTNTYIESGQAFFVHSAGSTGNVTLKESSKVGAQVNAVFRPTGQDATGQLVTSLYAKTVAPANLSDVNVVTFNSSYSNSVDVNDVIKFPNDGENLSVTSNGKQLWIEGRQPIEQTDTIFFALSNLKQQTYQLEFNPTGFNMAGLTASLQDIYLGTSTAISVSAKSTVSFIVTNNPASAASNRLRIVFDNVSSPVPVTFVNVSAAKKDAAVQVMWNVAAQTGVKQYVVETSVNGVDFTQAAVVTAKTNSNGTISYNWTDVAPQSGNNFYRIKSVELSGEVKYSDIVKVDVSGITPDIQAYYATGGQIGLKMINQPAGKYGFKLMTITGQELFKTTLSHAGGTVTQSINVPSLAKGVYQLEVAAPGKIYSQKISIR
ncbi:beta strand repeat-containing protein [Ferruginibacter albus]|uniref:beta strand repeat-containing protein n=1 Tax=Ferruginibacter albus TaxID=2875540 RepID=UPI001CC3F09F|nr:fibronectin type III domain-containing protein [Ferruginibacter albus]UAY51961.1 fibronectin type III domain-containing protein [Ferruginibacter albus]